MHAIGASTPSRPTARLAGAWTSVFGAEHRRDRRASAQDVVCLTAAMAAARRAGPVRRAVPRPGLRRRHRRAARGDLGRRARDGRAAPGRRHLRDVPEPRVRPGADGRRAAPAAGDVRARPRRASPGRTGRATTACGTRRCCRSCPGCGSPRPATRPRCANCSARRSRCPTAPTVVRFPKATVGADIPALQPNGRLRRAARAAPGRDVLLIAVGPLAGRVPRGGRTAGRARRAR